MPGPSPTTVHHLPDACLARCLEFLPQKDRLAGAALVSKRFHTLACRLGSLTVKAGSAAVGPTNAASPLLQRLRSLLTWLLRHGGSLRGLDLTLNASHGSAAESAELSSLLHSCVVASNSGDALQRLSVGTGVASLQSRLGPLSVGAWVACLRSLRHLAIATTEDVRLFGTLEGLTELGFLSIICKSLLGPHSERLPATLTKLCLITDKGGEPAAGCRLQVGQLTGLVSLALDAGAAGDAGPEAGCLLAGMSGLSSLRHLSLDECTLGDWLPACAAGWPRLEALAVNTEELLPGSPAQRSLDQAVQACTQLTALHVMTACESPFPAPAAAQLRGLRALGWFTPGSNSPALPHGPWQGSLRHLVLGFVAAAANVPLLQGMHSLERLTLTHAPCRGDDGLTAGQWEAFWDWVEQKGGPLRRLEICLEDDDGDAPARALMPSETLNALLHLAGVRPEVTVVGLPYDVYMLGQQLLAGWRH